MKKIILLVIICVITLCVFLMAANTKRNVETNYENIRPLEIQKSDISLELDALEREYDLKLNGMAQTFLLFSDFNTEYFHEVTNLLDKYGYYGTLILSEQCFPSKEGYLSIDEFNALIRKGWNYCILYENAEKFDYLHRLFEVNGMRTDTVYFKRGTYDVSMDDYLMALGYKSVVHHGENELNLYQDELNNGIWHVGNMGLVGTSPRAKLIDTIDVYGAFSYTISFNKDNKEEFYDYETLTLVMNAFNTFVNKDALKVTDLERGLVYRQDIIDHYEENNEYYLKKKASLNKELEKIEKQIEELERE